MDTKTSRKIKYKIELTFDNEREALIFQEIMKSTSHKVKYHEDIEQMASNINYVCKHQWLIVEELIK